MKASLVAAAGIFSTVIAGPVVGKRATTISNDKTPPVSTKGNAFYTSNGDRFYIRGVDYQPGGSSANADPIADADGCSRDVEEFKKLGINTIRVYSVDNAKDHDACMKTLADAGIYLALDVNTPFYSLNRKDNASIAMSYNDVYLQSVFATIDAFSKYDNTLLFYSANEVINDDTNTFAAPYVKAVTRDMKAYIAAQAPRPIPVGYSAADVESNRYEMATYMNCGNDAVRSDFFAFNDYSWCDPSSFTTSGWDQKVKQYSSYGIPIFLSEFGCNTNKRDFGEIAALYSDQMTGVYSGGLVYEYSQEDANYGLVNIAGDSVEELDDFAALEKAYAGTPPPAGSGGAKDTASASQCPAKSEHWEVDDTTGNYLPTIPEKAKDFLSKGAGAGPGNDGNTGSQTAGTPSTGFAMSDGSTTSGSSGSSTTSKAAAASVRVPELSVAPFVAGVVVLVSSLAGGASLFF